MTQPLVLKFGGELLEEPARMAGVVAAIAEIANSGLAPNVPGIPVVVVHGGGKEIDAALKIAGIEKRQVDGLRITDAATLDIVVAVLAGSINTRFVAALGAAGVPAVGLTGADGSCGLSQVAPPHRTVAGQTVDLGRVGLPASEADVRVLEALLRDRLVPVVASIGVDRGRTASQRQRRYDGRTSRGEARGPAPRHRRLDARRAGRNGSDGAAARPGSHRAAGGGGNRQRRDDCQAACVRTRAQERRGRRRDRGRPRSRRAARGGLWRGAGVGRHEWPQQ